MLHIAAKYDRNGEGVSVVAEKAPQLLIARNSNDDMALHVAARAGHVSSVKKLLAAHLRNVTNHESLQMALNEILTKNKRGNTFIHEALLSGHNEVVENFLSSEKDAPLPEVYEEMVAAASFKIINNQGKSILYLAIEAGCEEVVKALMSKPIASVVNYPGFDSDPDIPVGKSPLLAAILKQDRGTCQMALNFISFSTLFFPL